MKTKEPLSLLPKVGLCPLVLNRNAEREFWEKEKKITYSFARQRSVTQENILKTLPHWERLGGGSMVWGVENRAIDKDQGRGKLALFLKASVY